MAKKLPRWALFAASVAAGYLGARAIDGKRRNPRERRRPLSLNAFRAFKEFHWGRPADATYYAEVPPPPTELVELGQIEEITYSTVKGDEDADYVHAFGTRGRGKPGLAYDPKTESLHFVGGTYTVEDRGIVG